MLLLLTSAVCALRVNKVSAADTKDHPNLETADHPLLKSGDLKSETCLKCHATKKQGKFVHTAVVMGCDNCHLVTTGDDQTTVMLQVTGGSLCAKCHEINKSSAMHGPYQAGECLICHDPHTSAYPAQTRAATSILCLACHMLNQPEAHVNAQAGTVTLFDGRVYSLASWQSAPKVSARHGESGQLGVAGGANSGKKTAGNGAEANCLSCHAAHGSDKPSALRSEVDGKVAARSFPFGDHREIVGMSQVSGMAPVEHCPAVGGQL